MELGVGEGGDDNLVAGRAAAVEVGEIEGGPAEGEEFAVNEVSSATAQASAEAVDEPEIKLAVVK